MNKVITINLSGRAYQLEEDGYQTLQDYLKAAEEKLNDDPDKKEVMADLEQAMAEKLEKFLRPGKNVISKNEADEVLKEMGPVQGSEQTAGEAEKSQNAPTHKRLYRIREGAMLGGVCTGLAAYFNVDVTLIRVIFVVLTVLTHVACGLIYLIMWLVVPSAKTDQQKAAAFGLPFTAQEWINRARSEYQKFAQSGNWHQQKREWKEKLKQQKREMKQTYRAQMRPQHGYGGWSPFFGMLIAVISLLWAIGLLSLISKGVIFGLVIPVSIPLWIAILGWVCVYGLVTSPLKFARFAPYDPQDPSRHYHHQGDFLEGIAWLAIWVIVFWAIYQYVPSSRHYFQNAVNWLSHIWQKIHAKF